MFSRSIFLEKGFSRVESQSAENSMTYSGTINKSMMLLFLLFISSGICWYLFQYKQDMAFKLLIIGVLSAGIIGFITSIFPKISPVTAPIYTVLEGLILGTVSAYMEKIIPGIVTSAVLATLAVCTAVLLVFKTNPRIANKFRNFIVIATLSIALLYALNIILGFIGLSVPYLNDMGPIGIAIDIFIIIIAAGNLLLDFQLIYEGVNNRAPKYMEWYASFGIILTLILMYTKILEVLFKIFGRDFIKE
jgi:uncharacterized YccA/Bax inhibitor family protein